MKRTLLLPVVGLLAASLYGAETIGDFEREIKDMMTRVSPSVLKVVAENAKRYVATGIAIEGDLVITTTQLLQHPLRRIVVETARGDDYPARLVGQDRLTGIALLRLERRVLTPITMASGSATGDWVALVGAFYDRFPAIVQGLVSSVGSDGLILNAPVAPGSPGGAAVNRSGQLTGVIRGAFGVMLTPDYSYTDHSAELVIRGRREREESLCFALPVQTVLAVAADLKKFGRVRRAWLGVSFDSLETSRISEIKKGSPAAQAGLREGDEIVGVNGSRLQEIALLRNLVQSSAPDQELRLDILRERQPLQVKVRLTELPEESAAPAIAFPPRDLGPGFPGAPGPLPEIENFVFEFSGSRRLGIETVELTPELARKFQVGEGNGLLISRVSDNGVARKAGLQAGDVIVRVAGNPVPRTLDLHQALSGLRDGEAALLDLYRDGRLRKFSLVPAPAAGPGQAPHWDGISDRMRFVSEFMKKAWLERAGAGTPRPGEKNPQLRRQQEQDLKRAQAELRRLDLEKNSLDDEPRRQVADSIRRLQDELRRIQEMIRQLDGEASPRN